MRSILFIFALLTSSLSAQMPDGMAALFPVEDHPDLFYEATISQDGWGETNGWFHQHWTGEWTPDATTRTLMVSTFSDPDLRLPPVMNEMTVRASDEGLALIAQRTITAELEDEVVIYPENHWILPWPLSEGQIWTSEWPDHRSWSRIVSLDEPNPNSVIATLASGEACTLIHSAMVNRRTSGAIAIQVSEAWLLDGFGPVKIIEHSGVVRDQAWDDLPSDALGALLDHRNDLPRRATLMLVPPAGLSF